MRSPTSRTSGRSTRCWRSGSTETGRAAWVEEELAVLTDPATYRTDPDEAWTRVKTRSTAPRFLAALRELARFRETMAQSRNVPRGRILKDDALLELAANRPHRRSRISASRGCCCARRARGDIADGILAAIAAAEALPAADDAATGRAAAAQAGSRRRSPTCCGCCSRPGPRPRAWRSG